MNTWKAMAMFIIGVLVGLALSAVSLPGFLLAKGRVKFLEGRTNGITVGRFETAETLEKEFGHYDGKGPYTVLLSVTGKVSYPSGSVVKTSNVVCIETNGVKTVRVIP